jgi:hypothetical protein
MAAATEQTRDGAGSAEPEPSIRHLTDQLHSRAAEFGAYAKYLLSLQIDRFRLTAWRVVAYVFLGIAAVVVVSAALVAATSLLLLGLAGLVGKLVGSFWLGATIVGLLVLAVLVVAAVVVLRVIDKRKLGALRLKYEGIRQKQKKTFGRDIKEVADAR